MYQKIKDFVSFPKGSGLMFLVLMGFFIAYCTLLFDDVIYAEDAEPEYNKNWVSISSKNWVYPNSAFAYTVRNPNNQGEYPLNWHGDFTCSQKCAVICKYDSANDIYTAYAITLKGNENSSPLNYGSHNDSNGFADVNLVTVGNNNYNMQNVFTDWYTVFPEWVNSDYWVAQLYTTQGVQSTRWEIIQYDYAFGSAMELRQFLEQEEYEPKDPNAPTDTKIPMLHYHFKQETTYGAGSISKIKEIMSWDFTEYPIYAEDSTNYYVEMIASTWFKPSPTGIGDDIADKDKTMINDDCKVVVSNGGCNVAKNQYSFFYKDVGVNLYGTQNKSFNDLGGYYFYVRTHEVDGGRVSDWKVFNMGLNGVVTQADVIYSDDGVSSTLDPEDKDDDTISAPTYTPDNSTSAGSDPSSTVYNGEGATTSFATLIANLKDMVNQLGQIPSILATVLTFLPSWLITLIALSIGLFVAIGLVKLIIKG